jgi:L-seryl-tRNA(Ser) seleniumtransferase
MWEDRIAVIENAARKVDGVITKVTVPPIANVTPTLNISWDSGKITLTRDAFMEKLRNGDPSIAVVSGGEASINITVWMLKSGQEKVVAKRVQEVLREASV